MRDYRAEISTDGHAGFAPVETAFFFEAKNYQDAKTYIYAEWPGFNIDSLVELMDGEES